MKSLFIWREESKNYINELSKDIGNKTIICNIEGFQKIEINDFQSIYILVELNWSDSFSHGYKIASSIIENWKDDDNPPHIQFFSFIGQLKMFGLTKDLDKFFVKSFTHYTLPYNRSIKVEEYSKSKWKYLKKYALTEFGILNRISHSITTLLSKNHTF